jgi:hypothetical protein
MLKRGVGAGNRAGGRDGRHMLGLLLGSVWLVYAILPAAAQTPRSVFFNPSQSSIPNVGDSAVVALSIDDASQINAYDFVVQYDSTVVRATNAVVQSPFTGCLPLCTTPGPTPPVGLVNCSWACLPAVTPTPPINMINITFQGQANGTSPLQMPTNGCGLTILVGTSETPVPCNRGSGNIVVGLTPTPTPTSTNTPTSTATGTSTATATVTATGSATNTPTVTPTATITSTPQPTSTVTQTGTPTLTATTSPTRTVTTTATATGTNTLTPTVTQSPTITATRTTTNTPTITPTATATATLTATPLMAPAITGGAVSGSTTVTGTAIANPNPNTCISIFDCGSDACGNANDVLIGTGGVDGAGNFLVNVTQLRAGERIYPRDTCNPGAPIGPAVVVQSVGQIPDLSIWGAALLACALVLAAAVRLQRVAARR